MTYEEILELTKAGVEIWRPVVGYEGYFEISNLGRVKSVDRFVQCNGHPCHIQEKIKSTTIAANGYPAVTLCKNGKSKQTLIHRLLMEAFVPNPEGKPCIDHINTIKTDNRLNNLRWVTHKENSNNTITLEHFKIDANSKQQIQKRLETRKANGGDTAPITVFQYTKEGEFVAEYQSTFEAQRATGIYCTSIRRALDDSTQTAGEFMWFTSIQSDVKYKRRLPKNTTPILQFDSNKVFIREWSSLTEVSKGLKLNINMLSKSIKQNTSYKGHIFKYKTV